jgi:CheY-like chemotaxis protein
VDDNLLNQQMALVTVALEGHKVEVADNGREAVEAVARGEFDLILMDIDMPVMDGLEATQAIRAMAGPQRDVWIVAVTGCEIGRSRSVCEALSFDDVIAKPYPPEALVRALMWIDETRPRHGTGA